MTKIKLAFDSDGESKSLYVKGADAPVFVRKIAKGTKGGPCVTLLYAKTGEPTAGNQYVVVPTVQDMEEFLSRNGYRALR